MQTHNIQNNSPWCPTGQIQGESNEVVEAQVELIKNTYKVGSAHVRADVEHNNALQGWKVDWLAVTLEFDATIEVLVLLCKHLFAAENAVVHLIAHPTPTEPNTNQESSEHQVGIIG